jgi:hypothetical protein
VTDQGSYKFKATPSGIAGLNPSDSTTSTAFPISPGPNTIQLVFTNQPGGGANGAAWATTAQPQVSIENGLGVVQTSNTTPISISIFSQPGTGASLSCPTFGNTITPTNGVASFAGCEITGTAGSYVLRASASGIPTVQSNAFSIAVGAPAQLVFTSPPSSFTVKKKVSFPGADQPGVEIEDSGGNLTTSTASVKLNLVNNTSGAKLSCTSNPVSASGGIATFAGCSIDTPQGSPYALQATIPGLTSPNSSAITVNP